MTVRLFVRAPSASSPNLRADPAKYYRHAALALLLLAIQALSLSAQTPTPVPVLTWRYDLSHAGQNTHETLLTPQNVDPNTFGKLFSLAVDSNVMAQPLYVPALKMSDGLVHNVLFVATENDSIYAFDADSNGGANATPLWKASLLNTAYGAGPGATAVPNEPDTGSQDVWPTVGITGTPVIDPATNTLYVVSNTKENGNYFSRLHAINIVSGKEQPGSPVAITATVNGTGHGSSNGQLAFSAVYTNQRPALALYNGHVFIGYSAHGDQGPYHGWLFSYDAKTLQQTDVLCLTPNGYGAGLWGSGAGYPIDVNTGKMFLSTGNGTHSTFPPFNANSELGESIVAFDVSNGKLTPTDAFTTYNFQQLNDHDWDQGSGGVLMVPDNNGPNPHMLITGGKEGRISVLNWDDLGGYLDSASSNTNALQDITGVVPQGLGFWSTPAYWNGHVYLWANKNVGMMFDLVDGVMDTEPDSKTSFSSQFPEPTFSISSNGTQDGIAWAVRDDEFSSGPAILYAFDANDLSKIFYESDTNAKRDSAGIASKFTVPVVTNGKVYVATDGEVDVYGLFNGTPNAEAPVITPNGGSFSTPQTVEIATSTPSATIFYTLDGSTPTPSSTAYTEPITISADTTVKAMVSAPGYIQSGVTTADFNFTTQTPAVTFSPVGGVNPDPITVILSDSDPNATIYYTTDGSTPSASSTRYTGGIAVKVSETINAIAIDPALQDSNVTSQSYVIQNGGTSIPFGMGFASTAGLTLNGSAIASNDTRLQLTDGGLGEAGSVFWNAPIGIQAFTTNFDFQISAAQANGFTFTIQNSGPTALGGGYGGLGYQGIPRSVAVKFNFYNYQNEGSDSTGLYTNGQPPVQPSVDMSGSGVSLLSGDVIHAQITYDGTTLTLNLYDSVNNSTFTHSWAVDIPGTVGGNTAYVGFTGGTGGLSASQKLLNWKYSTQAVPPAFSLAPGAYTDPQQLTLTSKTSDATIYYTVDNTGKGITPTANSTKYSGPVTIASPSQVIEAIAISPTFGSSTVVSQQYTIQNSQAAAGFSLAATQAASVVAGNSTTSTLTITPSNGFTGAVALSCTVSGGPSDVVAAPTCTVKQPASISGTQPVTATLTINTQSTTTAANYVAIVTGTAAGITATASVPFTVSSGTTSNPLFALSATPISIPSAGANGSSVVTVTPSGGFTGTVQLSCAVSGGPAGAIDPPTCSVTQPPAITGSQAVTATLTVDTIGTTAMLHTFRPGALGIGAGGTLALLFFCFPFRRRKWQTMLCMILFAAGFAALTGCGANSKIVAVAKTTTPGTYTVTVTGTSGTQQATASVALTVQ